MSFGIGDTVGTYRIVAAIGSGGMGEVFRVEHVVTKRVEAMKILAAATSSSPEQDQRFLREIQLQASLSHPNIAAVHNAFWEDGHLVMIMELIQGASLRTLLEGGRIPLTSAIDYGCQTLAALDYAHSHGVVHRDVSPANMIITEDGTLKLTDFGLAKSVKDIRLTQTGALVGSLYYTSPEQVRGEVNVDARSDIYSMGAVLYEMATGAKPFSSDNPFTLMLAHVEETPRRPGEVDPSLPSVMDKILLKALEKNPENRFQSAESYRCALEALRDAAPVHAGGPVLETGPQNRVAPAVRAATGGPPRPNAHFLAITGPSMIRRSYLAVAAAALAFALLLSYAWKSPLIPKSHMQAPLQDFAALPFAWPANLIAVPSLSLARTHRQFPLRSEQRGNVLVVTDENGVRREIRSAPKNPVVRAIHHVVHPFRRGANDPASTAAVNVSTEPSTN
ncbi:MAG TPA: serine/threonine-protein kinase [Bryobacteraceae bacterium]|nr:serine/threonine-protein kinase [Bryobacteraceae bacterium]